MVGSPSSIINMNTILTFLTALAFVAQSFQNYIIQRLHKIYQHCGYAAAVKDKEDHERDYYCSVCLSQICEGEKVRSLPVCNHRYHADCIGAWLKNHTTCPLCRNKITDHIQKHKQVKSLGESMFNLIQSFSDLLVAILYMVLPSSITQSFPLVHWYFSLDQSHNTDTSCILIMYALCRIVYVVLTKIPSLQIFLVSSEVYYIISDLEVPNVCSYYA